jgi:hypothetical protein
MLVSRQITDKRAMCPTVLRYTASFTSTHDPDLHDSMPNQNKYPMKIYETRVTFEYAYGK